MEDCSSFIGEETAQGVEVTYQTGKWQSWDLDPGLPTLEICFIIGDCNEKSLLLE